MIRYKRANPSRLWVILKLLMKDVDRGAMSREDAAKELRDIATMLEERLPDVEQLELVNLDDLPKRLSDHLAKNRSKGNHYGSDAR